MPKGLTRNDLLYILNEAFKISKASNNALEFTENGLYVESYKLHSNSSDLHMPSKEAHDIVAALSTDENGTLLYNGEPAGIFISDDDNNALEFSSEDGGLFVRRAYNQSDFEAHVQDDIVHVTQEDRDKWDGILDDAKDYTDDEIDKIKIHNVVYLTSIPEPENMDPHTMYILLDQENIFENPIIVIKVLNEVVKIGVTKASMNNYYTKTEIDDTFETKDHSLASYMPKLSNKDVLEILNNDNGHPVFNNKKFLSSRANNGLSCDSDGGLFYPDISSELNSLQISAAFAKTNLYDQQITDAGVYTLKDSINNYNLLLAEYWFKPPATIRVPIRENKYVMHKAEEYEGYSYTFGIEQMEDWFDKLDNENQIYTSTISSPFRAYYDYDLKLHVYQSTRTSSSSKLTSRPNNSDYWYREDNSIHLYSEDEYLEYKCRFNFRCDYFSAYDNASRFPEFVLSYFVDDNNVEHKLSIMSIGYGITITSPYATFTCLVGNWENVSVLLVVDPVITVNNAGKASIRCSRYYNIGNRTYGYESFLGARTIFIVKTSSNVKLWLSDTESEWMNFNIPTSSPRLNFNLDTYGETLLFKDKAGKIGYCINGYLHTYRRIYNHMFEQHIYYESLDSVITDFQDIKNPDHSVGYAKTALMDTDNMEYLYRQSIGYTLELGYGISDANIKLRMHDNKLYVDHLTNTCIYRITGIGKGQSIEQEPDIIVVDDNNNEEPNEEP